MATSVNSEAAQPKALFVTPIPPEPTGNGLAMRASITAEALARSCNLSTAIIPVSSPVIDEKRLTWIRAHSAKIAVVPLPTPADAVQGWLGSDRGRAIASMAQPFPARARLVPPGLCETALKLLDDDGYDIVWIFRQYLAGLGLPFLARTPRPRLVMDADEDDGAVLRSIAELEHVRRNADNARSFCEEALAYSRFARAVLGRFDEVVMASEAESERLGNDYGLANVATIPNAVRLGGNGLSPRSPGADSGSADLLFVGNLDYAPNADAVNRLVENILPKVRDQRGNVRLHIVGGGGTHPQEVGDGVRYHGQVESVDPFYDMAAVAIVPLSAGGGTRIKLLEAFAKRLPAVATPEAAAGLGVVHGEHLLIGSTDKELADGITNLIEHPSLAQRIAGRAHNFVSLHHDAEEVMKIIEKTALRAG